MRFRAARIKAGLSDMQAADALSVSDVAVYQWETGVTMPAAKRLSDIARLYNVTIDELLSENLQSEDITVGVQ